MALWDCFNSSSKVHFIGRRRWGFNPLALYSARHVTNLLATIARGSFPRAGVSGFCEEVGCFACRSDSQLCWTASNIACGSSKRGPFCCCSSDQSGRSDIPHIVIHATHETEEMKFLTPMKGTLKTLEAPSVNADHPMKANQHSRYEILG